MSATISTPPSPPPAPQRSDGEQSFWQKCDAFVAYIATLGTYLATFVTQVAAVSAEVLGFRDAAAASLTAAQAQAQAAATSAADALRFAQTAQVETPSAWNATVKYAFPQTAAGSDGQTYRCLAKESTGEDPVSNGAVWLRISNVVPSNVKLFFISQS